MKYGELVLAPVSFYMPELISVTVFLQNSKFLQFVSKMSRGELIVEDNQVKPGMANAGAGAWADEFQQQHPESWAAEFTAGEVRFIIMTLIMKVFLTLSSIYLVLGCCFLGSSFPYFFNYTFKQHIDC